MNFNLSIFLSLFTSFSLFAANDITLVSQQENSITLNVDLTKYSFDNSTMINGVAHTQIIAKSTYPSLLEGNPNLPHLSTSFQLPKVGTSNFIITSSTYKDYTNINMIPSKGNLKRNVNPSSIPYSKSSIYTQNSFYPQNIASLNQPFVFRSIRGQAIQITPFQYNPITKTLRVYTNIQITVNFNTTEDGFNEINNSKVLSNQINQINQRRFINYNKDKYTPVSEDGSMLIICKDDLIADMQDFVNWKIKKGIPTEIVAISSIGNNQTSIYNYVDDYYANNPGFVYLLIVGDHADVKSYNAGNAGNEVKWSDSKYGLLVGNNDWYPDVFVGRFSASNSSDLSIMLDRNMEYEITPMSGDWYKKAIGLGSNEGQGIGHMGEPDWQHLRNIRTDLMNFGFTEVFEFYDGSHGGADANGDPNGAIIMPAVNEGITLFNYTGHGAQNVCVTGNFGSSHINQASNNGKYPFVISVACNNGTFTTGPCISEAWMLADKNNSPTGAISACGSSILMSWAPPMATQDEIVDILVESYANNKKFTLGGLFYNGQMEMMDTYSNSGKEVVETWVFFGDPSVKIRTADPIDLTATHSPVTFLEDSVISINNCNASDAFVVLSQNNLIIGTGMTDANGDAQISVGQMDTLSDVTVVATKYNYRPYQGSIDVIEKEDEVITPSPISVTLYPNPISLNENLTISFSSIDDADVDVYIYNLTGKLVKEVKLSNLISGINEQSISIRGLSAGVYELYTIIDSKEWVSKFVIK